MTDQTRSATPEQAPADKPEKKETVGSYLRFLVLLFVITLLVRSLLFAPFTIPSGSMLPNLLIGDYLFVSKWPYGYSRFSFPFGIINFDGRIMGSVPDRGDIVVFRYPGQRDEDLVKRVIGVPGDRIELRDGIVILNGQPIPRERIADFLVPVTPNSPCRPVSPGGARVIADSQGTQVCAYPLYRETMPSGRSFDTIDQIADSPGDDVAPFVVAPGHVFVMGDNRDDSLDGRFPTSIGGVGQLPIDYIQGRALVGFFSTDGSAGWLPWTWLSAARWERIGQTYP